MLLLSGACAKSAQVPLQAWLGDAMEGPTPVSALIHAATMVTAGVYLIVRSNPLYSLSPDARLGVIIVGAVTLLFGAFIGCAKDDIKRALAASTMSQIGYMVLAAGLGPAGYVFAIMHLLTHGFFKAGLFLGSGSIIHAMHEEQDMRQLRGAAQPRCRSRSPRSALAIWRSSGCGRSPASSPRTRSSKPPSVRAGSAATCMGGAALLGAGVTAFYMTRVMLMTFFGEKRWAEDTHPHEAPALMAWPMILLAVGSVFSGGLLGFGGTAAALARAGDHLRGEHPRRTELGDQRGGRRRGRDRLPGRAVALPRQAVPETAPAEVSVLTVAARRDLYGDAFNEEMFMRPGAQITHALVEFDDQGVDGSVNALANLVGRTSEWLRGFQTGFARNYALSMLAGAALVAAAILAVQTW